MFKCAILMISMLSSVLLYSADVSYHSGDTMGSIATTATTQDPDLLSKFEAIGFFGRQRKKKLLEGFEHCYSSNELTYFLATKPSTEPTISPSAFANAKTFVGGLQQAIEEELTAKIGTPDDIRKALRNISKHALYFCRTCCELELKKRVELKKRDLEKENKGDVNLGKIWAEHPLKFWPCSWERVDAATFYKACAYDTTFYSKKSDGALSVLLDATK